MAKYMQQQKTGLLFQGNEEVAKYIFPPEQTPKWQTWRLPFAEAFWELV